MSNHQFSFYLKLNSKQVNPNIVNTGYISKTIYSTLYYPKESVYKIITSINPCDSVLLSYSKQLKGSAINKKMIYKDDLFQYHLNHNETAVLQFSLVFNELLSNEFISNTIIQQNIKTQNIFVFGRHKTKLIEQMLNSLIIKANEIKLSFYSFDQYTKNIVLVHPSFRNISVLSSSDISNSLLNMKNEYKLSQINMPRILNQNNNENPNTNNEDILIIVAKCNDCIYNCILSYLLSIDEINEIINSGFNFLTSIVLNINGHSDKEIEIVKQYHSMFNRYREKKLKNDTEIPNTNTNRHCIKNQSDKNNDNQINKSYLINSPDKNISTHTNTSPNLANDTMLLELQNKYLHLKQEKLLLEKMNKKISNSLEQERQEKLNYINQNSMLSNQIKKLKDENAIVSSSIKDITIKEQEMFLEMKQREYIDNELKEKVDLIKTLTEEKSYIEVEYQILNEKYQDICSEYKQKQLQYEESNKNQDQTFKKIEEKISKLEIELSTFQKDNINLHQMNQDQLTQIDKIKQQKENYFNKYKLLKKQLSLNFHPISNKINTKETQYQYQFQSQNKLIENLRAKIKQINTESIS